MITTGSATNCRGLKSRTRFPGTAHTHQMKLEFYKTLWGWKGTWKHALAEAADAGFAGVEGPLPASRQAADEASRALSESGLSWICEISTTGYAAPEARASVAAHLAVLRSEMERALPLRPLFFTSMAGDDCWSVSESVDFFAQAVEMAASLGVTLCCETHRARSLFHPRVTAEILEQVPGLVLTADFSHWCNVCERLVLDEYPHFLDICAPRVRHIHGRVGYDQGAQVPDPRLPRYSEALEAHIRWWTKVWRQRLEADADKFTVTPEFGPDGYQQILGTTDEPFGDLWEINRGMAAILRERLAP